MKFYAEKRNKFFLEMCSDAQEALEDRCCNDRNSDIRKNKSDIWIIFFTTKITKNHNGFPERLGMECPSLRMTDFNLKLLNILIYLMLLGVRSWTNGVLEILEES